MRFGEYGQQWMMTGSAVFARVVSFQRTFLLSVTLEHRRVEIQAVTVASQRQALNLPLCERFEESLHMAHPKSPKQVADRIVGREPRYPQQRVQRPIAAQPPGMRKSSGSDQHRDQKR
jgi:hypothetical protein